MGHELTNLPQRRTERLTVGRLQQLHEAGVSIWLDTLSRDLLESGEFERLIRESAVTGATSNPPSSPRRSRTRTATTDSSGSSSPGPRGSSGAFLRACARGHSPGGGAASTHLRAEPGADGFISFECTPDLADDTDRTIEQALDLWDRLDLPNILIKVPATAAGVRPSKS